MGQTTGMLMLCSSSRLPLEVKIPFKNYPWNWNQTSKACRTTISNLWDSTILTGYWKKVSHEETKWLVNLIQLMVFCRLQCFSRGPMNQQDKKRLTAWQYVKYTSIYQRHKANHLLKDSFSDLAERFIVANKSGGGKGEGRQYIFLNDLPISSVYSVWKFRSSTQFLFSTTRLAYNEDSRLQADFIKLIKAFPSLTLLPHKSKTLSVKVSWNKG